jgi:hypothetical protein
MKIKKIKVTEKNIDMLAGLIQKYFDSFKMKDSSGTEYNYQHWKKRQGGSYSFWGGKCIAMIKPKFKYTDGMNGVPDGTEKVIRIDYPVRHDIHIGDFIHLDGNHFMYGGGNSIYQKAYFRDTLKRYDVIGEC